jgi:Protein of unknown function (DUF2515)
VIRPFFLFKKKKIIWKINGEQEQKLLLHWNKMIKLSEQITINYKKESELIERIKNKTDLMNQNNITRTTAYLAFFKNHPEIHWSFLAHMVSRNAGYFMTDLKGEFLPDLISDSVSEELYHMLEKGNSLIFQDAYPQLLLYEESKKRKQSLFYLSRYFKISPFMEGVWEEYFQGDRSPLLPVSQIINEQSHIEKHLIQTEQFQKLQSHISYRLQKWLQLSQILFPVSPVKNTEGKIMQSFDHLNQRIQLGLSLYVLLFDKKNLPSVYRFACKKEHTGSRSDYNPTVFST